ncbi:hypothetical protein [Winogradskyella bathintestinalis]|uniref:Glycine dehydrogenase n=1 Tax=Winogradskyella bathintestinalis TaxID=3035208 RepID=A0ABT7ZYM2_9FLAO|nr:hypothetical protein [Winogradskyella bathintestinalis]MDN3493944.1 hypothetical protein [Winogradskyella bathintestinalis]
MKKSFLFISCEEAKHICDKAQYNEASIWEHFKLSLRLMYCRITKSYSSKNKQLSKVIETSEVKCLKAEERRRLQNQFNEALSEQQQTN